MSSPIPSVDLDEVAASNNMTREQLSKFLAVVKNGMLPAARIIPVTESGILRYYTVERRGVGPIVTAYGTFWLFDFEIDDQWKKYSVIVKSGLDIKTFTPKFTDTNRLILRTDSGCETGQMFGDLTCDCGDQLLLAMEAISQNGEGMIVNIPSQDGRGMGLPFKLGTLWLQDALGVHTIESASMLPPTTPRKLQSSAKTATNSMMSSRRSSPSPPSTPVLIWQRSRSTWGTSWTAAEITTSFPEKERSEHNRETDGSYAEWKHARLLRP